MADSEHTPTTRRAPTGAMASRRALLAGVALVPAAAVSGGATLAGALPSAALTAWTEALDALVAARATFLQKQAAFEACELTDRPMAKVLDRVASDAYGAMCDAEDEVLFTCAPDTKALQFKTDIWFTWVQKDDGLQADATRRAQWAVLVADMMRLGGDAAAAAASAVLADDILARDELFEEIETAGGRIISNRSERGWGEYEFTLAWAPTPPSETDLTALADNRSALVKRFDACRDRMTWGDFKDTSHETYDAWRRA